MDVESDALEQAARIFHEIGDGGPAGLLPNPGEHAGIARDFPLQMFAEQFGDFSGFVAAGHAGQELLREANRVAATHGKFQILGLARAPRSVGPSAELIADY